MGDPEATQHPNLTVKALAMGLILFALSSGPILWLSHYVQQRVEKETQNQLEVDSLILKHQLERELNDRTTALRHVVSFWAFTDEVSPYEYKAYSQYLLGQKPGLFRYLVHAGPDMKVTLIEPEESYAHMVGLDVLGKPMFCPPLKQDRDRDDTVVVGKVHRDAPSGMLSMCLQKPIVIRSEIQGAIIGVVGITALLNDAFPAETRQNLKITLREGGYGGSLLFSYGDTVVASEQHGSSTINVLGLGWHLDVARASKVVSLNEKAHIIILIVGLSGAIAMASWLPGRWVAGARIKSSQEQLQRHAKKLEAANIEMEEAYRRKEEAIAQLEAANVNLEETNLELAKVNRDLGKANSQLRDLNKELDDFNHVVGHDLKEPLRGIQAFSQFLLEDYSEQLDDMGRSYLETLKSSATRMQHLINDLLQLAKVTKSRSTKDTVEMSSIVDNALSDLAFAIRSHNARVNVPTDLPFVWGDPIHLLLVVKNLISNGIRYNEREVPEINIQWFDNGQLLEFIVEDNGLGIEERYHKRVFELFERLVTQEQYEGTGAGLAISKKIVEQHGGSIWVDSAPGQGSRFHFTLPPPRPLRKKDST